MALARTLSRAQVGLRAPLVQIEVHLGSGLPCFSIVGLPAPVVRESKERVRAALVNSAFEFPAGRITVNLAPAELPKEGGRFDLPIALGVLVASGQLRMADDHRGEFYGELGLGGELKPVPGLLPAAVQAADAGHLLYLPEANLAEARLARHATTRPARDLVEVCALIEGRSVGDALDAPASDASVANAPARDAPAGWDDVQGQWLAKRALTVAAVGEHSLLMIGPPGCGKSMLAQRYAALLPPLDYEQSLEVAAIASLGLQGFDIRRWAQRPFRAPHHTSSASAVIGGGREARPGEMSLAHHGVLFLDELPEFDRRVLEGMREPLETGEVSIARAAFRVDYPARFQLIAAMNPCACGHHGDAQKACRCPLDRLQHYRARISGPLLDRIDLRIEMFGGDAQAARSGKAPEPVPFTQTAERVRAARELALRRAGKLNARLAVNELEASCALERRARTLLEQASVKLGQSMRGEHRALRVARSIADLAGSHAITEEHVAEALQLRKMPKDWG